MNKIVLPVKGTRDFYPVDFALRDWLYQKMKLVSERYGYQEYDGPEIEYVDLYTNKTSEEILREQVFTLTDKDNRLIALRPELTPTVARMVAQKSQQLTKPIRWFMFGRGWRYEQPQKGRGREFFQWEINILGPESPEADAEILSIAAEYFKELHLTPDEVVIRVSDRSLFENFCDQQNIESTKRLPLIRFLDRIDKIPRDLLADEIKKAIDLSTEQTNAIIGFVENKDYSQSAWLTKVFSALENYSDNKKYVEFDPKIFRGFDYYTRTVFEAWDKTGGLKRAIFGGGRFDNLTETLGGERVPGVGMAPGDMPILELLKQFNKLPEVKANAARVLVTVFSKNLMQSSLRVSSQLRSNNINTELYLGEIKEKNPLEKQFKYADQKNIPYIIVIGPEEVEKKLVTLKNMQTREQKQFKLDEAINELQSK